MNIKNLALLWVSVTLSFTLAGCSTSKNSEQSPDKIAQVHTELAGSYYGRQQYAVALQELGVALQAEPNYAPGYGVRGLVRMALHEDELAEADFKRSLRLDPKSSESHNNYGWFLCQRGKPKESLAQFAEAVSNPLYATPEVAYANAGMCAIDAGDMQLAEAHLQRALILRPGMPEALFGLSKVAFVQNDFNSAKNYFFRFQQAVNELNAAQLGLAIQIERKVFDRNSEASYTLQLQKRFPDSREAQLLQAGQ